MKYEWIEHVPYTYIHRITIIKLIVVEIIFKTKWETNTLCHRPHMVEFSSNELLLNTIE